jgi:hypothetical protein
VEERGVGVSLVRESRARSMNLNELIEQLELIKQDHPHSAHLDVRVNDLDVFAVNLKHEDQEFVEIELFRPFALDPED